MFESYQPQDEMSLWWLGAAQPRRVGSLMLVGAGRKVALEYDTQWIQNGFALSEDLPLAHGLCTPKEIDRAAGALEDARPDRWGERVIRQIDRPARLSILEFLYFAGDERFGALGVSLRPDAYEPRQGGAISSFESLPQMELAIARVLAGERLNEDMVRLIRPGPSFGGARPKSLIKRGQQQWLVKFSEGEDIDTELIEHASMSLAAGCGIVAAPTQALPLSKGHAVAIERFDRKDGKRQHVLTAMTALRAAGQVDGYPQLAQLLRRIGDPDHFRQDQHQLFRRMVFNILMDNTDDHHKNHALIRTPRGHYRLSPAYDVVPSAQGLGYQQMRVGKEDSRASLDNALSEVAAFGLQPDLAVGIVREVCQCVASWKSHFAQQGVKPRDIELLAQYIDGSSLLTQRNEF
jgi:serine/threonine-protein kinase HipA